MKLLPEKLRNPLSRKSLGDKLSYFRIQISDVSVMIWKISVNFGYHRIRGYVQICNGPNQFPLSICKRFLLKLVHQERQWHQKDNNNKLFCLFWGDLLFCCFFAIVHCLFYLFIYLFIYLLGTLIFCENCHMIWVAFCTGLNQRLKRLSHRSSQNGGSHQIYFLI